MKQEITRQMAEEMVKSFLTELDESLDKQKIEDKDLRVYYKFGAMQAAFAHAIVKGQLSKEDLGIK